MVVKFGIQLPDWYERKLKLWAALKGTNRATLAANILQTVIESNWSEVEKEMQAIAKYQNMTVEELEREWLDEED